MMFANHHSPISAFLDRITRAAPQCQLDCLIGEVLETGGTYTAPGDASTTASHLYEISLHGIAAFGRDEQDALRNWIRAAQYQIANAPMPMQAPRNHAEEIANVYAELGGLGVYK